MEKINQYYYAQLRSFYDEAWERLAKYPLDDDEIHLSSEDGRSTMSNIKKFSLDELLEENWSPEFNKVLFCYDKEILSKMRYRLCLGSLRYGKMGDKKKASKQDRMLYIKRKFDIMFEDKNLEPLIDISNVLLLESIENNHPNLHCSYSEMISDLKQVGSVDAKNILRIYYNNLTIPFQNIAFFITRKYGNTYQSVYTKDCLVYDKETVLECYGRFLKNGNSAYLGIAIHVCHGLYRLLLELVSGFSLKAKDDDEHIPIHN